MFSLKKLIYGISLSALCMSSLAIAKIDSAEIEKQLEATAHLVRNYEVLMSVVTRSGATEDPISVFIIRQAYLYTPNSRVIQMEKVQFQDDDQKTAKLLEILASEYKSLITQFSRDFNLAIKNTDDSNRERILNLREKFVQYRKEFEQQLESDLSKSDQKLRRAPLEKNLAEDIELDAWLIALIVLLAVIFAPVPIAAIGFVAVFLPFSIMVSKQIPKDWAALKDVDKKIALAANLAEIILKPSPEGQVHVKLDGQRLIIFP